MAETVAVSNRRGQVVSPVGDLSGSGMREGPVNGCAQGDVFGGVHGWRDATEGAGLEAERVEQESERRHRLDGKRGVAAPAEPSAGYGESYRR